MRAAMEALNRERVAMQSALDEANRRIRDQREHIWDIEARLTEALRAAPPPPPEAQQARPAARQGLGSGEHYFNIDAECLSYLV